jgi:hypothetical protein
MLMSLPYNLPRKLDGNYMAGLPDGIFPYQNLQFWFILRGRGMEILEMVYSLHFGKLSL